MKIVNLTQFRALPEGTLFLKYTPCCFEELCVKGETLASDFTYGDMAAPLDVNDSGEFIAKLQESEAKGTSIPLDFDIYSRDGCFDEGQLFAVYEKDDVVKLLAKVQECMEMAYK